MKIEERIAEAQQKLLTEITARNSNLNEAILTAFQAIPRHCFIRQFYDFPSEELIRVDENSLETHLPLLYSNCALLLFKDQEKDWNSPISQPSLVLEMIDKLQLQTGHRIFEVGTGSGWNAALMAQIVGSEGAVYSADIIPEMVASAQKVCQELGLGNVKLFTQDGGNGLPEGAPFDRIIFTVGTHDIPWTLVDQLREGGLMLVVIQNPGGGGDSLFLLEKSGDQLNSREVGPCSFVSMQGISENPDIAPIDVSNWSAWETLRKHKIRQIPYYWGGKGLSEFVYRTEGVRAFLSIVEPRFHLFVFSEGEDKGGFGLVASDQQSAVIATSGAITAYGQYDLIDQMLDLIREWVTQGMPVPANFQLEIHPSIKTVVPQLNQWLVRRRHAQFLWKLPASTFG